MLKNNKFFIKKLKNIIFLGYCSYYDNIEDINSKLNLSTFKISSPSFKTKFKSKKNIKFFTNIDNKFEDYLKKKEINKENSLFISFGSRWIFNRHQINNIFWNNLINFHGTRLPIDAGGGGFSWRILRGDRLGCNLAHVIDEKIDTGPIIANDEYIFPNSCKKPIDYENFHFKKFIPFYEMLISQIKSKRKITLLNQNKSLRLYNPRLKTKINGWINWNWEAEDIFNFINAFDEPYEGASTTINNKFKIYLKEVHLHKGEMTSHPYSKGLIIRKNKDWIVVAMGGNYNLLIEKVLDNKGKNIFKKIKVGDRLITDIKYLQKSLSYRPIYK